MGRRFLSLLPLDVSGDPFAGFRAGFATLIQYLFGLVLMVSLAITVIHVIQGDQDSAKKMFKWLIVGVVGLILISVIKKI